MEPIRLQKYLAHQGVASRRAVETMIEEGRITVDGAKAKLGDKVTGQEDIMVSGKRITAEQPSERILIAFNKPRDVISSMSPEDGAKTLADYNFETPERLYPVGRLDRSSHGLVLMTNDGDLANQLTHPRYAHEKEYIVKVDKPLTEDQVLQLSNGSIKLDKKPVKRCIVEKVGLDKFRIVLTEGRNRQIRRMSDAVGLTVRDLQRIRITEYTLEDLMPGQFKKLEK